MPPSLHILAHHVHPVGGVAGQAAELEGAVEGQNVQHCGLVWKRLCTVGESTANHPDNIYCVLGSQLWTWHYLLFSCSEMYQSKTAISGYISHRKMLRKPSRAILIWRTKTSEYQVSNWRSLKNKNKSISIFPAHNLVSIGESESLLIEKKIQFS